MYGFTNLVDKKGGTISGACVSFNGWAMKKRGPVLVSMFSPIGTVCSLVLSVVTLGESINIGRYITNYHIFLIIVVNQHVRA